MKIFYNLLLFNMAELKNICLIFLKSSYYKKFTPGENIIQQRDENKTSLYQS